MANYSPRNNFPPCSLIIEKKVSERRAKDDEERLKRITEKDVNLPKWRNDFDQHIQVLILRKSLLKDYETRDGAMNIGKARKHGIQDGRIHHGKTKLPLEMRSIPAASNKNQTEKSHNKGSQESKPTTQKPIKPGDKRGEKIGEESKKRNTNRSGWKEIQLTRNPNQHSPDGDNWENLDDTEEDSPKSQPVDKPQDKKAALEEKKRTEKNKSSESKPVNKKPSKNGEKKENKDKIGDGNKKRNTRRSEWKEIDLTRNEDTRPPDEDSWEGMDELETDDLETKDASDVNKTSEHEREKEEKDGQGNWSENHPECGDQQSNPPDDTTSKDLEETDTVQKQSPEDTPVSKKREKQDGKGGEKGETDDKKSGKENESKKRITTAKVRQPEINKLSNGKRKKEEIGKPGITETKKKKGIKENKKTALPSWCEGVSKKLLLESENNWRLLASELGYTSDRIEAWSANPNPCSMVLEEWFARPNIATLDAIYGIYKKLVEIERNDAAILIEPDLYSINTNEKIIGVPDIFITYNLLASPPPALEQLKDHLTLAGYSPWTEMDQMDITDLLLQRLDDRIADSQAVIVCVTEADISMGFSRELDVAVNNEKPLILVWMDENSWDEADVIESIPFTQHLPVRFFGDHGTAADCGSWFPDCFMELLMQVRYFVAPNLSILQLDSPYLTWCDLPEYSKTNINDDMKEFAEVDEDFPEVFLSYQWDHKRQVEALNKRLTSLGFNCWMDVQQMGGGDPLYVGIDSGIRTSKVVLSCLTKKYIKSPNCTMELELAHGLQKPIIPVLLEAISWPPEGFAQFAGKLAVDFTEDSANIQSIWTGAPFDELVKRINKTVKASFKRAYKENRAGIVNGEEACRASIESDSQSILDSTEDKKIQQHRKGKSRNRRKPRRKNNYYYIVVDTKGKNETPPNPTSKTCIIS